MDIVIQEPLNEYAMKLYQGSRWRYATMTDVKFFRDNYIIAAHRYGCKIYVIRLHDNSSYTIHHSDTLIYNDKPYQTEAFVIINNTIYMLSFSNIMTLIDILPDFTLRQRSHVELVTNNVPYHGIAKKGHMVYITPSKQTIGTEHILTYNTVNGILSKHTSLGEDIRVKALAFLPNNMLVVVVNYKETTTMTTKGHTFNGSIRLYSDNYTLLDSKHIASTHFDGIVSHANKFYATGADLDCGYIYEGVILANKIGSLNKFQVKDFPHGIDIKNGTVVYTSYATSGIHFLNINHMI